MRYDSENSASIKSLKKRADELNCLYRIMEILKDPGGTLKEKCSAIIRNIPYGLQSPAKHHIKINLNNETFYSENFAETGRCFTVPIYHEEQSMGSLSVYCTEDTDSSRVLQLNDEEARLIRTIAGYLGIYLTGHIIDPGADPNEWQVLLDMLKNTNRELYYRICRKLLIVLNWEGHEEAARVLESINRDLNYHRTRYTRFRSHPDWGSEPYTPEDFNRRLVNLVQKHLSGEVILKLIQMWIQEEKLGLMAQVGNQNHSIDEIAHSLRRYIDTMPVDFEEYSPTKWGIQISLIRKFLSDQTEFIDLAKNIVDIRDFHRLLDNLIYSKESRGKLGGKGAVFFLIEKLIRSLNRKDEKFGNVKTPKTWYISSDIIYHFMGYNDFEDVIEQKYKDPSQIRMDYPNIIQSFRNGRFPEDIIKILSSALDDFGEVPLIVRSSSLLEAKIGSDFVGKYHSVFLSNQGSKSKRLTALTNAIAEVYASIFAPEPLEYRNMRHLLDCYEEMGILIQEVVGEKQGNYFLPLFAGVASSENEYLWSPHVKSRDGLLCMVPGLWAPCLGQIKDDYLILFSLGQSGDDDTARVAKARQYLPKKLCALNMETARLEIIDSEIFLESAYAQYPELHDVIKPVDKVSADNEQFVPEFPGNHFVYFKGLLENTPLVDKIRAILESISSAFNMPVSIDFAFRGDEIYIVNCRIQQRADKSRRIPIPKDIPKDRVLFSVSRNATNDVIDNITHIIYIDPAQYVDFPDIPSKKEIGSIVGRLNKLLPKKKFILIGPWKWIKSKSLHHGVEIDLSDIDSGAAVIDIPLRPIPYIPEFSYETYLFQDLLKANIHYLMLYTGNNDDYINRKFLKQSPNIITDILPESEELSKIIKVIDLSQIDNDNVLRLTMNSELNEAIAYFTSPTAETADSSPSVEKIPQKQDSYWRWRLMMAEHIAANLDADRFGVKNMYIFGSTKNATAGPCSDIDLIVHFGGTQEQLRQLKLWFEGWSLCLSEMNYLRTGYKSDGLLEVQIVTDDDIVNKSSFASMIGAVTDPARPLKLKRTSK